MGSEDACEELLNENKLSPSFSPPLSSSIVPLTPDPNRGNGEQRPEFSSPLTLVVDVNESSPPTSPELNSNSSSQTTPKEALFDSFAPGPDKCALAPRHSKYKENESRVLVVRRLDFSFDADLIAGGESNDVDKKISEDEDEEHCLFRIVYEAVVDAIVSEQKTERVGMVSDTDEPVTPKSAPRLSWIAETCPGAPIKSRKLRNFDLGICKMLEF